MRKLSTIGFLSSIYNEWLLLISYLGDYFRYRRNSITYSRKLNRQNLDSILMINSHSIEKGLSNTKFRFGFGRQLIEETMEMVDKLLEENSDLIIFTPFQSVLSSISEYYFVHNENELYRQNNLSYLLKISHFLQKHSDSIDIESKGGTKTVSRTRIIDSCKLDFSQLSTNRFSIRDFSTEKLSSDLIYEAINLAMTTPSVCNRQGWSQIVVSDFTKIQEILTLQGGFKGYGENIQYLILITSTYNYYQSYNERNQAFVDGGSYSMSLIYALTYLGAANCPLNANLPIKSLNKVKAILNLDQSELLIMFIAVGSYKEENKIPMSRRYKSNEKKLRMVGK